MRIIMLGILMWFVTMAEFGAGMWLIFQEWYVREDRKCRKVAAIFFVTVCAGLYAYNHTIGYVSALLVLGMPVICYVLLAPFVRGFRIALVVWTMIYILFAQSMKLAFMTVEGMILKKGIREMNYGERSLLELAVPVFLMMGSLLVRRYITRKRLSLTSIVKKHAFVLFAEGIAGFFLMCFLMSAQRRDTSIDMLVLNGMALFSLFLSILLLLSQGLRNLIDEEREEMRLRSEMMARYYAQSQDHYQAMSRHMHDIKKERRFLIGCLEKGKTAEALSYLEEQEDKRNRLYEIWTGMECLDFLLNWRLKDMRERGICLTIEQRDTGIPISMADGQIIFGNLLDNAIEAAGMCEEGRRWLSLSISRESNTFIMRMSNSSPGCPVELDGRLISTKKDKESHGWGLRIAEERIRKYGGELRYAYTKKEFHVVVTFWNGIPNGGLDV